MIDPAAPPFRMPPRAVELFAVFSRFEYALKAWRYCRRGLRAEAVAGWDEFARDCLGDDFIAHIVAQDIAPVLRGRPPSRQVAVQGNDGLRADWKEATPPLGAVELFRAVRRVRNNLFHGGKAGTPDWDRDGALVADALTLLEQALAWVEDLDTIYQGP